MRIIYEVEESMDYDDSWPISFWTTKYQANKAMEREKEVASKTPFRSTNSFRIVTYPLFETVYEQVDYHSRNKEVK